MIYLTNSSFGVKQLSFNMCVSDSFICLLILSDQGSIPRFTTLQASTLINTDVIVVINPMFNLCYLLCCQYSMKMPILCPKSKYLTSIETPISIDDISPTYWSNEYQTLIYDIIMKRKFK